MGPSAKRAVEDRPRNVNPSRETLSIRARGRSERTVPAHGEERLRALNWGHESRPAKGSPSERFLMTMTACWVPYSCQPTDSCAAPWSSDCRFGQSSESNQAVSDSVAVGGRPPVTSACASPFQPPRVICGPSTGIRDRTDSGPGQGVSPGVGVGVAAGETAEPVVPAGWAP